MFLNPNNMNFKETVSSNVYVDKTGLIEYTNSVISTTSKFICNSRPRRFGKSMTADMLCAYYSKGCDSKELFIPYHISSSPTFEKYLNQYDVIRIDVQACIALAKGVFNVVDYIENECIQELKETYSNYDLLRTDTLLGVLHEVHMKTGNQFVVIIDEWDVLFRDYKNQTIQNQYLDFLRSIFKNQYASECIALAYLTGILPIKKTQTQSALNNFDEYTMLNPGPLAPYFGFTEKEVQYLCQDCFSEVKKWYDGYLLGNEHVYNPKAVVSYLNFHILQSYWTQTSSYESIDKSIVSSGNYERYFKKDGKIYHHILDPSTGYPIENNLNQVTIISDKSVDGDALSTTCYALGLDEGLKLIRSMDNIEAVFITDDNTIHKSSDSVNLITDIDN